MIIQLTTDKQYVLFNPENPKERKILDSFPGFLKQGLQYFSPNKQHVIYNLYRRLKRKISHIKYTSEVRDIVENDINILDLPPEFKFHTEPLPHQRVALRFAYTFGSFLNLSEPGLGKTKVTLDYIWLIQAKKSLIICPKALLFVWEEETLKHRPELKVYTIKTTDWNKEWQEISKADVVVINYDKAVSLEQNLMKIPFTFIAVDEGLIKNHKTDRTQAITRLGKKIPYRCVMSGTLVNNSPLDVWAPLHFIEPSLVGSSFYKFKEEYALVSRHNRFITIGFRHLEEIKDILACCGIIMTKQEWLSSLPPKEFKHIYVTMSDEQREAYFQLANNYLVQFKDEGFEVEVDNPLAVMIKLNQISNGFIYYKENIEESLDELFGDKNKKSNDKRKVHYFRTQPKADALLQLIGSREFNFPDNNSGCDNEKIVADRIGCNEKCLEDSLSGIRSEECRGRDVSKDGFGNCSNNTYSGRRAIIWYNLAAERTILEKVLGDAGIPYLTIAGGQKDIGSVVREFNDNPNYRFLICQSMTINYGVTVMGSSEEDCSIDLFPEFDPKVSDEIFYSIGFSLERFLQQQDRIHRIGQTRKCRYWILLSNSKIERKVAERLEEKLICNKEILVDIMINLKDFFEEKRHDLV